MSNIDDKVVSITFDNARFESKLSQTIKSLDNLNKTLQFKGVEKGFGDISRAADKVNVSKMASSAERSLASITRAAAGVSFSKMADGIQSINSKFSTMGAVAFTTIQSITRSILGLASTVVNFAKTDILGPILTGGKQRALNIEQAKFMFEGLGIDIEKGMASAKAAVLGTAFGLDEAAKAAAQFGASGIEVGEKMTSALRGVAGAAALSGSSFTEIADIFAGSAGSGKVTNQDLLQFSTRGLNAAASLAKVLGTTEAQIHEMATEGKLDFKTFAEAMDKAFGEHATKANRTYAGALANMRAAMSRLGESFFGERLTQQRDVLNALTPVIDGVTKALKPLTAVFLAISRAGADNLVGFLKKLHPEFSSFTLAVPKFAESLLISFNAATRVMGLFKQAFRDVFPKSSKSLILSIAEAVRNFVEKIKIGGETATNIRNIFRGLFSIISIGFTVLKGIIGLFGNLISTLTGLTGVTGSGVLAFFGNIGQAINKFRATLVAGGGIKDFFDGLGDTISTAISFVKGFKDVVVAAFSGITVSITNPIEFIRQLKDNIVDFFNGINGPSLDGPTEGIKGFFDIFKKFDPKFTNSMEGGFERLGDRLEWLGNVLKKIGSVFGWFFDKLVSLKNFIIDTLSSVVHWFADFGPNLAKALKSEELDAILKVLNTVFLGLGASGFRSIAKNGLGLNVGLGGSSGFLGELTNRVEQMKGSVKKLNGILDAAKSRLKAMQTEIKAKALLNIAIAVGILAVSLTILSTIDPKRLATAMTAMAVGFGQLVTAMALLDKAVASPTAAAKLGILAGGLILLASAMVIFSVAMKIFATMSLGDIAKGLIAFGGSLTVIAIGMQLMPSGAAMIAQSAGLILIGTALGLIAGAMKIFATMSLGEMAKGLIGVGGSLVFIGLALKHFGAGPTMIGQSLGLIAIGVALNLIAASMKIFATIGWAEMAKGLVGIAGGLTAIAIGMQLMPLSLPITALGVLILSNALIILAGAIKLMGGMKLGTIAKGIGGFAATLAVLAIAMQLMSGALPGAAATFIVASALVVMVGVLEKLAALEIRDIVKGLATLAGIFLVFGLAAIALSSAIGPMIGLGIALGILGAAFALFGVGANLLVRALELVAKVGVTGARALVAAFTILQTAIPEIIKSFVESVKSLATELLTALPVIIKLIVTLVDSLLNGVIKEAPKLAEAFGAILTSVLDLIREKFPEFQVVGFELLLNFLTGLRDNIGDIVTVVSEIIVNFLTELTSHSDEIVTAGVDFIVSFLIGIANNIGRVVEAGTNVLIALLKGISDNISKVIEQVTNIITTFITEVGKHYNEIITAGANALAQFIKGIFDNLITVTNIAGDAIARFITAIGSNVKKISDAGVDTIIAFFNGMKDRGPAVVVAISDAVSALVTSFTTELGKKIPKMAEDVAKMMIDILNGVARVIRENARPMGEAWANVAEAMVEGFGDAFKAGMAKLIRDKIPGPLQGVVRTALGIFDIASPSKVFFKIGENVVTGLSDGFKSIFASKSPSKVFYQIGENIVDGFRNGVTDNVDPANSVIMKSMSNTIAKISDSVNQNIDFNPVITPVLDLTKIQSASNTIGELLKSSAIIPEVSVAQAQIISTSSGSDSSATTDSSIPEGTTLKFEQNNYSPTALSTNDIYRNTKSQIALAKEKLGIS